MGFIRNTVVKLTKHHVTAVILAAGSGTRMGSELPKQFLSVDGKTVLARSIEAFESSSYIKDIIVVTNEEYVDTVKEMVRIQEYKKVTNVLKGGKTRFESSFIAMEAMKPAATHICVHDAARCLVTPHIINTVTAAAFRFDCVFAASKVVDTVKVLDKNGITKVKDEQLLRDNLVAAATPQVFKINVYRAGAYIAKDTGFEPTDDCSLMEKIGFACRPILFEEDNFKVTLPSDIPRAEFVLKWRAEQEELKRQAKKNKNKKNKNGDTDK